MKVIGITSTAVLSLLLGIAAPAYTQQDQQGAKQDHPQQQHAQPQRQQQQPQHAQQQQQRQSQNNQKQNAQQQQHAQQQQQQAQQEQRQSKNNQQQHAQQQQRNQRPQRTQQQQRVQQAAWQQHRSQRWDSDHRNWQQRGGYNGYRIPDDRFRGYFGQDHGFRIYGLPFLVVGGYPRFQYNGYWFSMVDPWPGYWANDWYDTDDVYVTYVDNGYYLFDRRYPNVGIAISISM
jgi:hypothetical protein